MNGRHTQGQVGISGSGLTAKFEMPRRHPCRDASQPGVPGGGGLGDVASVVVSKAGKLEGFSKGLNGDGEEAEGQGLSSGALSYLRFRKRK